MRVESFINILVYGNKCQLNIVFIQLYIWTHSGCDSMQKTHASLSQTGSQHGERRWTHPYPRSYRELIASGWKRRTQFYLRMELLLSQPCSMEGHVSKNTWAFTNWTGLFFKDPQLGGKGSGGKSRSQRRGWRLSKHMWNTPRTNKIDI